MVATKQNGPPFGGPFVVELSLITETAQVPERAPGPVLAREPALVPERALAQVPGQVPQVSSARE
ncbi:hypothetical protein, partial [Mesorhizobium sp.]|uniref:hypothetical protein n=1 Tax=Mesorhizobium sp. TaxID=1871066 RepID=UPI0025BC8744